MHEFLGQALPVPMDQPRMTSIDGDKGLLMTFDKGVYSFQCITRTQCFWNTEEYELNINRDFGHIMMLVPTSLIGEQSNCGCELDATHCGCKDPVPINQCKECAEGFYRLTDSGCRSKRLFLGYLEFAF